MTNGERPAALLIAPILPSDRGNGLAMRAGFFLNAYAKAFAVDLAVVPVAGVTGQSTAFAAQRTRRILALRAKAADTQFSLIGGIADPKVRLAAFTAYGRPSIAAKLSPGVETELLEFAGETRYSLVHVSRLYLASLARRWMTGVSRQQTPVVLDCDEDDVSAYRRFARLHRRWGRDRQAAWAEVEAEAFKSLAGQWLQRFDLLFASSLDEARLLATRAEGVDAIVIPNVTTAARPIEPSRGGQRRDILFVGNMSYLPNADAAMWFGRRVWPLLRRAAASPLRFVIAGAGPTREIASLASQPGISVTGGFDDIGALYRRAAIAVVPIRAGGGTRIKLLEAARYGIPIVATRFGASGTGLRSGQELLLADKEHDFAACCARLLTDLRLSSRLVAAARRRVLRDYDPSGSSDRLLGRIKEALKQE
jgi:glycosyltransferase involved in cell wall biosynthesis